VLFSYFLTLEMTNGKKFCIEPRQSVSPVIQAIQPGELDDFETRMDHQTEVALSFAEVKANEHVSDEPVSANFDIGFDHSFLEEEAAVPASDIEPLLCSENLERPLAVPTPPSFEELAEVFDFLDKTNQFPVINVLELIETKQGRQKKNLDSSLRDQVNMPLCTPNNDACPSKRSNFSLLEVESRRSNKKLKVSTPTSASIEVCHSDVECFHANVSGQRCEYVPSPDRKTRSKSNTELEGKPTKVPASESPAKRCAPAPEQQAACPPVSSSRIDEDACNMFDDDDDFDEIIRTEFSTPALCVGKTASSPATAKQRSAVVDDSQLTFTQALACLHESFNGPGQRDNNQPPSGANVNCEKESALQKLVVEEPQFDLGFNLSDASSDEKCDDDDDDEVIPPSPVAGGPQKSRLSLARYGNGSQSAKSLVLPETQTSDPKPFCSALDKNRKVTFHVSSDDEDDDLLFAASNWSINNADMRLANGLDSDVTLPVAVIQPSVHSTSTPQRSGRVDSSTPCKKLAGGF
jgi:hypothetical protein